MSDFHSRRLAPLGPIARRLQLLDGPDAGAPAPALVTCHLCGRSERDGDQYVAHVTGPGQPGRSVALCQNCGRVLAHLLYGYHQP